MLLIAVINQSTLVSNQQAKLMVDACQVQNRLHLSPAWNAQSIKIKLYQKDQKVPGYAWKIMLVDDPNTPNALGYHDLIGDQVDAFIFCRPTLDNGGSILFSMNGLTISAVLSHEICEMAIDRFCNTYCDHGKISYAMEVADPVQNNTYEIHVQEPATGQPTPVCVSDFVFPSWFNEQANMTENAPFNFMKTLTKPFTLDKNGYAIIRSGGVGSERLIFGDNCSRQMRDSKESEFSRFKRRSNSKLKIS